MAAKVLGRRVHHVINAGGNWLQVEGGRQRRIDDRVDIVSLAEIGKLLQIDHAQVRIRGGLADQHPGVRIDGGFHRFIVARFHLARDHAKPRQVLAAVLAGPVITLVEENDLIATV